MNEQVRKWLIDIEQAIKSIESFTEDVKSFTIYQTDLKTKSAVERQLGIIGEAMTKVQKVEPVLLTNAKQIIQLRNRLVHAYDSIDDTIIWAILHNHLPILKEEITGLLYLP